MAIKQTRCVELVVCLCEQESSNTSNASISIAKAPKQQNTGKNPRILPMCSSSSVNDHCSMIWHILSFLCTWFSVYFHNPPNSDMDYKINNRRIWSFNTWMCAWGQGSPKAGQNIIFDTEKSKFLLCSDVYWTLDLWISSVPCALHYAIANPQDLSKAYVLISANATHENKPKQ